MDSALYLANTAPVSLTACSGKIPFSTVTLLNEWAYFLIYVVSLRKALNDVKNNGLTTIVATSVFGLILASDPLISSHAA